MSAFLRMGGDHQGEPDLSFARAMEDLKAKSAAHAAAWGLDGASWAADLEAGTITFTNKQGWKIVAPVQVIGTFNTRDSTWLWAGTIPRSSPRSPSMHGWHGRSASSTGSNG